MGREIIRVNITIETDEDDLIGGFRLVNGETVWHNGPVIEALERGAILLLDEIDLASNKILCFRASLREMEFSLRRLADSLDPPEDSTYLQPQILRVKVQTTEDLLELTCSTKHSLERFPVTFEQAYPAPAHEIKILKNVAETLGVKEDDFCKRLVDWADIIRKTFYDGGIEEIISTRRLVHVLRAFSIFNDKEKAIKVCINRFDEDTKQSFLELYDKVDADFEITKELDITKDEATLG